MNKTNFDLYLEEQLQDPEFAERFEAAGEDWEVALEIARLREEAGHSQKQLAQRLGTTQQQVSRLESPAYEGRTLSMLRRVAAALDAHVKVAFEPRHSERRQALSKYFLRRWTMANPVRQNPCETVTEVASMDGIRLPLSLTC